jgi:hypothetical protein
MNVIVRRRHFENIRSRDKAQGLDGEIIETHERFHRAESGLMSSTGTLGINRGLLRL